MQRNKFLRMVHASVVVISTFLTCSPCFAGEASGPADECGHGIENACVDERKSNLMDTRRLQEIIEKTIRVSNDPASAEAAKMDLPAKGTVTSKAGIRQDPIDGDLRMHRGIDIAIPDGTAVYPVFPGKVVYSGNQRGYGNMVIIRHEDGMITVYAHHSRNIVRTGDVVEKITIIAMSGSSGRSTGPHLHFEAWQAGRNITNAFLPNFSGHRISVGSDASLDKTDLRKVTMSDGTILYVEVPQAKN